MANRRRLSRAPRYGATSHAATSRCHAVRGGTLDFEKNRVPQFGRVSTGAPCPSLSQACGRCEPSPELEKWWRRLLAGAAPAGTASGAGQVDPAPVSRRRTRGVCCRWVGASTSTKPVSVNFTALVARFRSTRDNARLAPAPLGHGVDQVYGEPFSSAIADHAAHRRERLDHRERRRASGPPAGCAAASSNTSLAVAHRLSAAL